MPAVRGTDPRLAAAEPPACPARGATSRKMGESLACPKASRSMSIKTAGAIELVHRIRRSDPGPPDAPRRGQLHSAATEGRARFASLASRYRGADHGVERSRSIAPRARRHVAGDASRQRARVLRSQGDALGQTEAEAGRNINRWNVWRISFKPEIRIFFPIKPTCVLG
jgi:hypothetical protein